MTTFSVLKTPILNLIVKKFVEAQPKPMLYRPAAAYVGKYCGLLGCEYIPLQKRTH